MKDDTKIILCLIERIGSKLPCKSGKKLETLEADGLIQHIVNAIVDLSRFKLGTIAHNLTKLLEKCMTNHWKFCQGTSVESLSKETSTKESLNTSNTSSSTSSLNTSNTPNTSSSSNLSFKLPRSWDDPPPLDDNLAVFILKVLSRFLYQMDSLEDYNPNVHDGPSGEKESPIHNVQAAWSPATYELVSEIFKSTRRVIFYIERSNSAIVRMNPPFVSICQSAGHDIINFEPLNTSNTSSPTSSSSPLNTSNTPNTSSPSNSSFKPRSWDDPLPLNDLEHYSNYTKTAKTLKFLSRFLYQMDSLEDYNQNIHDGPSGGKESPIHNVQAAWSPATYELVSEIFKSTVYRGP
uniref:Uncharacterized protein n=1 Tax=Rhizophagus irregularis (strain DAOM 181602 / DAOM 197198 / MUCL 43194) TaxID=747089 RepID=U9UTB7_RHIID